MRTRISARSRGASENMLWPSLYITVCVCVCVCVLCVCVCVCVLPKHKKNVAILQIITTQGK